MTTSQASDSVETTCPEVGKQLGGPASSMHRFAEAISELIIHLQRRFNVFCETRGSLDQFSSKGFVIENEDFAKLILLEDPLSAGQHLHRLLFSPTEAHGGHFICGALALAARVFSDGGEHAVALDCAEKAVAANGFDLYAQDMLVLARGRVRDGRNDLEEIDQWLTTRYCEMPFEAIESTLGDTFTVCCPMWLPIPIGTFSATNIQDVLNSDAAKAIQSSIADGSFRYCSRLFCQRIANRELPERDESKLRPSNSPRDVVFSHDPSCNLSCPSCRKETIIVPKSQQEKFDNLSERFFVPLMEGADRVKVTGSGDPFASIHFRNLLKEYTSKATERKKKIILHTNGVLCDERSWSRLDLSGHVASVMVSLDAATEETYNFTRRGGDFNRVIKNVEFLSRLRSSGDIGRLELLFVVQAANFREMPLFVEIAKYYDADSVLFQTLNNWGTYSAKEFLQHNIFATDHPDHDEFVGILRLKCLSDPIVDLGNISSFKGISL